MLENTNYFGTLVIIKICSIVAMLSMFFGESDGREDQENLSSDVIHSVSDDRNVTVSEMNNINSPRV